MTEERELVVARGGGAGRRLGEKGIWCWDLLAGSVMYILSRLTIHHESEIEY